MHLIDNHTPISLGKSFLRGSVGSSVSGEESAYIEFDFCNCNSLKLGYMRYTRKRVDRFYGRDSGGKRLHLIITELEIHH